jgi:hypothetical protein
MVLRVLVLLLIVFLVVVRVPGKNACTCIEA